MNNNKSSFILYTEHKDLINELSNEQAGELLKKLFDYAETGTEPQISGMQKMAFIAIKHDLDRNALKYAQRIEAQRRNGQKGGRPKKEVTEENPKNPMVFSETQKSLYDNVNDNDNVLSLNEENNITREEREILENYVKRKKLANKSVRAYVKKLILNGDWKEIVNSEHKIKHQKDNELPEKERIKQELASIHDKRSCARVLVKYFINGMPPEDFDEVMSKYNLNTYSQLEQYSREISKEDSVNGTKPP